MVQSYKELIVWQKSLQLVKQVYFLTKSFPRDEIYGLTSQMRRAAVSIPANIAEGQKRKNTKEFLQFLRIANGSASELETEILISKDLYPDDYANIDSLLEEVVKMLGGLITKLESKV